MTRFQIYDTNGQVREVRTTDCTVDKLRVLLTVFRTECIVRGKQYEFNHLANWLRKYHDVDLQYIDRDDAVRIDM